MRPKPITPARYVDMLFSSVECCPVFMYQAISHRQEPAICLVAV